MPQSAVAGPLDAIATTAPIFRRSRTRFGDRMHRPHARLALIIALLIAAPLAAPRQAEADPGEAEGPVAESADGFPWALSPDSGNVALMLEDAVFQVHRGERRPNVDLQIDATFNPVTHAWHPEVWGHSYRLNRNEHDGVILDSRREGDRHHLEIYLPVRGDWWIPGGPAHYTIELTRQGDALEGTYTGTFRHEVVRGQVRGVIRPMVRPDADHVPLQRGEHPRLKFRAADIPRLQEALKTERGQSTLAHWRDRAALFMNADAYIEEGLRGRTGVNARDWERNTRRLRKWMDGEEVALLYRLTGEQAYADYLRTYLRALLEEADVEKNAAFAMLYDLSYDLFEDDPTFRGRAEAYFRKAIDHYIKRYPSNNVAWSNHLPHFRARGGIAALMLLGEAGQPPPAPAAPTTQDATDPAFVRAMQEFEWNRRRQAILASVWREERRPDYAVAHALTFVERQLRRYLATAYGSGGFNAEGDTYANVGFHRPTVPFMVGHANATGVHLGDVTNGRSLPVWDVVRSVWRDGERQVFVNFWPADASPTDQAALDVLVPTVEARYLPAVLWHAEQENHRGDFITWALDRWKRLDADVEARHPEAVLPKVWADRQKGGYVFRSSYTDPGAILFVVHAREEALFPGWSPPNAGAFHVYGMGLTWSQNSGRNKWAFQRFDENVVQVPEVQRGALTGRTTHFEPREDGSGTLSVNLDNAYLGSAPGLFSQPSDVKDLGIRGSRHYAVDYSGKSGAPALFVVVDRITGGSEPKTWFMFAHTGGRKPDVKSLTVSQNTFTLTGQNDATLQGTFVAPRGQVEIGQPDRVVPARRHGPQKDVHQRVMLTAPTGDFFVVMTLQKPGDPAPPVRVEGTGLEATVHVGQQTIRFDGQRIGLGETSR
jgi:hypothetical protein